MESSADRLEVWEESREIRSCEDSSLTMGALIRCAQMELLWMSLLWRRAFVAPTAKQFMHEKPLVPPLHSLFLPPLFLLGIGLLSTHTQGFKTLEYTSMLITSMSCCFGRKRALLTGVCVGFCQGNRIENWTKLHPAWIDGMPCKCTELSFFWLSFSEMDKVRHYLQCVKSVLKSETSQ